MAGFVSLATGSALAADFGIVPDAVAMPTRCVLLGAYAGLQLIVTMVTGLETLVTMVAGFVLVAVAIGFVADLVFAVVLGVLDLVTKAAVDLLPVVAKDPDLHVTVAMATDLELAVARAEDLKLDVISVTGGLDVKPF